MSILATVIGWFVIVGVLACLGIFGIFIGVLGLMVYLAFRIGIVYQRWKNEQLTNQR